MDAPRSSSLLGNEHTRVEPRRVPDLWFADGTIVIQAGNGLYRVYRGALASRSSVFHDMLSFPQPPESDLVEGCPFVELPDPEVEVTPFLRAIFDPEFFMPYPAETNFDTIVGCLRLSHKYEVGYLRRRALVHFSSTCPTTLSETDLVVGYVKPPSFNPSALGRRSWKLPPNPVYRVRAIQLVREIDAPWTLPSVFYALSSRFHELGVAIFHGAIHNGEKIGLSMEDQTSFLKGYYIQRNCTMDSLRFLSDSLDIPGCHHPSHCNSQRLKGIQYSLELLGHRLADPLYVWPTEAWRKLREMCPPCLEALKKTHQAARQAFWDRLPEIYDLPSWEVLEQLKTAALAPSQDD